jgi:uncharacterized membrane protein
VGLLLTLSVEFFYLTDNFRVRMNTIFKFYFQAWVLMALASAFAVYWLTRRRGRLATGFLLAFGLLFAMGIYPILGMPAPGGFRGSPTLDGTATSGESTSDCRHHWPNPECGRRTHNPRGSAVAVPTFTKAVRR